MEPLILIRTVKIKLDINVSEILPTIIVLEDLSGIGKNIRKLYRPMRILISNWSFYQLEQFIIYKATAKGIKIIHISAKYTSQQCSNCGFVSKDNRTSQSHFHCLQCNFKLHADLNASRNIRNRASENAIRILDAAAINQPIVSTSNC